MQRLMTAPWFLSLVIAFSFFWRLGALPLYDLDEGAFSEATREMVTSGNFITPHKDGEPRYDKPILIYWLQAGSVKIFGCNEFALRLPSAVAASLWVIALWFFVRNQLDRHTATVAGLLLTLSLQVHLIARAAVADALLNLWLALTFFEIYNYFFTSSNKIKQQNHVLRAFCWMGLGVLTKGPIAILLPLLISFLGLFTQPRRWLQAVLMLKSWLILLVIILPWHLAILLDDGPGFFKSFLLGHNLGRFAHPLQGHQGFLGYYIIVLPLILLPFSGWLLVLLPTLRQALADPLERFLWLWFGLVLLFFSFAATQLPHYLLYGATPLFILMARQRERLTQRSLAFLPLIILCVVLLIFPAGLNLFKFDFNSIQINALLTEFRLVFDVNYYWMVFIALGIWVGLALWPSGKLWQRLILAGLLQVWLIQIVLAPRIFAVLQEPIREAGLLARSLALPTVVYSTSFPSFSFYRNASTPHRAPQPGDLVFLRVDKLNLLARDYPGLAKEIIYQRGPVALVKLKF